MSHRCMRPTATGSRCPERRDVADARTIRLWVAVIHHDGPDAAPTLGIHLPGGPGFPASTGWVAGTIELDPRDSRTIVVVDERGTGRSEPQLACPEFDEAIPHDRTIRRPCRRPSAGWRRPAGTVSKPTVSTSTATTPSRAPPTSSNSAKRSASTSSSLRGVSYGARLAREIYRQDPAGVAGLLLDSPVTTAPCSDRPA